MAISFAGMLLVACKQRMLKVTTQQSGDIEMKISTLCTLLQKLLLYLFILLYFTKILYMKNFNIKNKDNKISQGRGNSLFNYKL